MNTQLQSDGERQALPIKAPHLTVEQDRAVTGLVQALQGEEPMLVALVGAAGTGKTTVSRALADRLDPNDSGHLVLAAPTHRAARVLASKVGRETTTLHAATLRPVFRSPYRELREWDEMNLPTSEMPACVLAEWPQIRTLLNEGHWTAESLLRQMGVNPMSYLQEWEAQEPRDGILLVDEGSMTSQQELRLIQQVYSRVVVIGDLNQLPPVEGEPALGAVPADRQFHLTEIHRQAEGSSVIEAAHIARDGGVVVGHVCTYNHDAAAEGIPVLCWRNTTRKEWNQRIRAMRGHHTKTFEVGEPVISRATGRQAAETGAVNNSMWRIVGMEGDQYRLRCDDTGKEIVTRLRDDDGSLSGSPDGLPVRLGYALTVHNAQGMEWPLVAIDQNDAEKIKSYARGGTMVNQWCYTAVTRAREDYFLARP